MKLLAPCGSFASLQAALGAGCDSVYFGIEHLNMRSRSSQNFTTEDMKEIAHLSGEKGVNTYLTLNTLLYDHDMGLMNKIMLEAKHSGVSGVIVSDMAGLMYAHEIGLPVTCSTQLSISNIESVRFFAKYADIIVLARELDLKMIKKITTAIAEENIVGPSGKLLEIEIFGHGAMCIAQSGRCSMSLFQYNASANRGACLQSCRSKYRVINEETGQEMVLENGYVMSPKDLSTIGILPQVMDSGVAILKMEGRGREPMYVKRVIETYREAIDLIESGNVEEYQKRIEGYHESLGMVYNRGMSEGYYLGRDMLELSGVYGSKATQEKFYVGKVKHYFNKAGIVEIEITSGDIGNADEYVIIGETTGVVEGNIEEIRDDGILTQRVKKGGKATFKTPTVVRKNDRVFVLKTREQKVDQN